MPFIYDFDRDARLFHIVVTGPSAIGDYQDIMPRLIAEMRDVADVLVLVELRDFAPGDGVQDHDLGFFFVNEIKSGVAKLAIACPTSLQDDARELTQIIRNHGRPAEVFEEADIARGWLVA